MNETIRSRDSGFDNLKLLLIILVVLGHAMEEFDTPGTLGIVRALIYSFHMPAFIFISGYFTKKYEKAADGAIVNCLIPFLIFNTLWQIMTKETFQVDPLLSVYSFWYLLSLFFWRIFIKQLMRIKWILPISIFAAFYVGYFKSAGRYLSVSRTIAFLPFFILGVMCSADSIQRIRKIKKVYAWIGLALSSGLTIFLYEKEILPTKAYENIQCYKKTGLGNLEGGLLRLLAGLIAFVMILCIINLISVKANKLTAYGTDTACIYLLSSFVIRFCTDVLSKMEVMARIKEQDALVFLVSVLITAIVMIVCGNRFVTGIYHRMIQALSRGILKRL